jgi:hypothetical protein
VIALIALAFMPRRDTGTAPSRFDEAGERAAADTPARVAGT